MLKLYKYSASEKQYWETWENPDGSQTIHWETSGREVKAKKSESLLLKAQKCSRKRSG